MAATPAGMNRSTLSDVTNTLASRGDVGKLVQPFNKPPPTNPKFVQPSVAPIGVTRTVGPCFERVCDIGESVRLNDIEVDLELGGGPEPIELGHTSDDWDMGGEEVEGRVQVMKSFSVSASGHPMFPSGFPYLPHVSEQYPWFSIEYNSAWREILEERMQHEYCLGGRSIQHFTVTDKTGIALDITVKNGINPDCFPLRFCRQIHGCILSVREYAPEILNRMLREESVYAPAADYMAKQSEISGNMRAVLVDWIIEVHMKYKLRVETLYLSISLIDRYLSRMPVRRKRLQLVGVVGLFVAAKFEEINPPEARDFVHITDNAYNRDDLFSMECDLLNALSYRVACPTAAHFLATFSHDLGLDIRHKYAAQYLMELSLLDLGMVAVRPSQLAAAAVLLSNELLGYCDSAVLSERLALQAQRNEQELCACARQLLELLQRVPDMSLRSAHKKFSMSHYHAVAIELLRFANDAGVCSSLFTWLGV